MSKTLLLEIGTEEVPAHVMPGILSQLKENAAKTLRACALNIRISELWARRAVLP